MAFDIVTDCKALLPFVAVNLVAVNPVNVSPTNEGDPDVDKSCVIDAANVPPEYVMSVPLLFVISTDTNSFILSVATMREGVKLETMIFSTFSTLTSISSASTEDSFIRSL